MTRAARLAVSVALVTALVMMAQASSAGLVPGGDGLFVPRIVKFHHQPVGSFTCIAFEIQNRGDQRLTLIDLASTGGFGMGGCPRTCTSDVVELLPGQSCTIAVNFEPTTPGKHVGQWGYELLREGGPSTIHTVRLLGFGDAIKCPPDKEQYDGCGLLPAA